MRAVCRIALFFCIFVVPIRSDAESGSELRNWFNDPFFQISNAIAGCPVPAGPFVTAAERNAQSHHRAERGTSCWLAGKCKKPNAYAYDREIAQNFRAALRKRNPFKNSTLWVTVQGRLVFIEGCVRDEKIEHDLETFARAIPYVQQAAAFLYKDLSSSPPYRRLAPP